MAKKRRRRRGGLTQVQAVAQALSELGTDALPSQIKAYLKEHFKLDLSHDKISTCKWSAKKLLAKRGGVVTGTAKSSLFAKHAAASANGPGISKMEAERRAL